MMAPWKGNKPPKDKNKNKYKYKYDDDYDYEDYYEYYYDDYYYGDYYGDYYYGDYYYDYYDDYYGLPHKPGKPGKPGGFPNKDDLIGSLGDLPFINDFSNHTFDDVGLGKGLIASIFGETMDAMSDELKELAMKATAKYEYSKLETSTHTVEIVSIALRVFIFIAGILANVLCLRTLKRMGSRDSLFIILFHIAVANLLYLASSALIVPIEIIHVFFPQVLWRNSYYFIPDMVEYLLGDTALSVMAVNAILTTFLAIQRSLGVVNPLKFRKMFTKGRTYIVVASVWLYCLIWVIPRMAGLRFGYRPDIYMWSTSLSNKIIFYGDLLNSLILKAVCLVAVIVCLIILGRTLKKSVEFFSQRVSPTVSATDASGKTIAMTQDPKKQQHLNDKSMSDDVIGNCKDRQVIVQVFLVSLIFVLANIPFMVFTIADPFIEAVIEVKIYRQNGGVVPLVLFFQISEIVVEFCYVFNCSVHILIFYKYNTRFRQLFGN